MKTRFATQRTTIQTLGSGGGGGTPEKSKTGSPK